MGYLVLAEQIGKAVLDTTKPRRSLLGPLKRAIPHFGPYPLTKDEQEALRGLRNALAHDYGLVSIGRPSAT